MATLTRYFRTDSTTGGDGTEDRTDGATRAYESLNAALVGEQADLTSTPDILHLICTTAGQDTTVTNVTGYTTGATGYIFVECQGSARNNGVSREKSSTGYQLKTSSTTLSIFEDYLRVTGLEATISNPNNRCLLFNSTITTSSDIRFDECLFNNSGSATNTNGMIGGGSNADAQVTMTNCLVTAYNKRAMDVRVITLAMDHCGVVTAGDYGCICDQDFTATNTYFIGSTGDILHVTTNPTGSYDASVDNSAATYFTNTVDIVAATNEFTTYSERPSLADMTLLDSLLNAAGTGSEAIDITGASRTGTADIGPFNFGAVGADVTVSGAPSTSKAISAGNLVVRRIASGAVTTSKATSAGNYIVNRTSAGAAVASKAVSAGAALVRRIVTGAAVTSKAVSAGTIIINRTVSGSAITNKTTSEGQVGEPLNAGSSLGLGSANFGSDGLGGPTLSITYVS